MTVTRREQREHGKRDDPDEVGRYPYILRDPGGPLFARLACGVGEADAQARNVDQAFDIRDAWPRVKANMHPSSL
jgi:hypothetical protein